MWLSFSTIAIYEFEENDDIPWLEIDSLEVKVIIINNQ